MSKLRFSERPGWQRLLILVITGASLSIVTAAERDIQSRAEDQVRGSRLLWRVISLNAVGAAVYFRWGRHRTRT
jgi:hypothetical protein